jgi:hypothetical protein
MTDITSESGSKRLRSVLLSVATSAALAIGAVASSPAISFADENGVSFWLLGLFGSLAAVPQQPGWSLIVSNYYDSVGSSGAVAASGEIEIGRFNPTANVNLNVNLHANIDMGSSIPAMCSRLLCSAVN